MTATRRDTFTTKHEESRAGLPDSNAPMQDDPLSLSAAEHQRLAQGDRDLVQRILQALFPMIHRWLHRTLADKSSVDDALQESLIELARALPAFRGQAKVTTFAHRITMRVAYRYFRRARANRAEELVWETDAADCQLEGQILARSELNLIHQLLDRLSEGRRIAFLLCEVEGLSPAEAAQVVGVPALVMRSRLCRARADIKRLLHAATHETVLRPVEFA